MQDTRRFRKRLIVLGSVCAAVLVGAFLWRYAKSVDIADSRMDRLHVHRHRPSSTPHVGPEDAKPQGRDTGSSLGADSETPADAEDPTVARIREVLNGLLRVEAGDTFLYDIVKQHLDAVLEVMAFLQQYPEQGLTIVRALYERTTCHRQKGLLVFIASAARESEEALKFFRAVMADLSLDSSVRSLCAAALGMANLAIEDTKARVRWHYATVLWATANQFMASHPSQVYVAYADAFGMGWPGVVSRGPFSMPDWTHAAPFGRQGQETRKIVLQILIDALNTETCLRTRFLILDNIRRLEDRQLLADVYMNAYLTDDWTIPAGHFCEGVSPVHGLVMHFFGEQAVETRDNVWVNALKWVQSRIEPSQTGFEFIVEPLSRLGLMDRAFVMKALYPFTLERPPEEMISKGSYCLYWVLWQARHLLTQDEFATLMVQVTRGLTITADKQVQMGVGAAAECLRLSKELPTEEEILRILLRHPDSSTCEDVAKAIAERGKTNLVPDLVTACQETTCQYTYYAIRKALKKLAPETLASLPKRRFPTLKEQLAEKVRTGEMSAADYDAFWKEIEEPTWKALAERFQQGEISAEEYNRLLTEMEQPGEANEREE